MPTIAEALSTALAYHQSGRLQAAEQLYRQIIATDPNVAEAWNFLGVLAYQMGQYEPAHQYLTRTLALQPNYAEAHNNLGNVFREVGNLNAAVASYRRALELKPQSVQAHNNLGVVLQQLGRFDEAIANYCRALALQPDDADTHNNLGTALHGQGRINEAIASYRRSIALKHDHVGAQGNLGLLLADQGRFDESLACFQKALAAEPSSAAAHTHVGRAWQQLGDSDQAIRFLRRALELDPCYHQAHNNLGVLLHEQGDLEAAAKSFERALALQPDLAAAHVNQSYLMLLNADFERGWPEFEWRWKYKPFTGRAPQQPAWLGSQIAGRTILLHAEQGFGDAIQFVRYAPLAQQMGAKVIVHGPTKLLPLLRGCPGIDQLIGDDEPVPPFDEHASLLSLPGILKTNLNSIPANVPYLHADARLVEYWKTRLAAVNGYRIGINWHGRGGQGDFRLRDMPLELFAEIADISSVSLISLQRGEGQEQLLGSAVRNRILDLGEEVDHAAGAFMDTAAIMKNIDLVISSDTSVAHLAGALGISVWVGLPYVPNWRWLLHRNDSPWYPTMRLFRQSSPGDWKGVFDEIKAALSGTRQ